MSSPVSNAIKRILSYILHFLYYFFQKIQYLYTVHSLIFLIAMKYLIRVLNFYSKKKTKNDKLLHLFIGISGRLNIKMSRRRWPRTAEMHLKVLRTNLTQSMALLKENLNFDYGNEGLIHKQVIRDVGDVMHLWLELKTKHNLSTS